MQNRRSALTLLELLSIVVIVATVTALGIHFLSSNSEEERWLACRRNLKKLAEGMAIYNNPYGDNRFYPWPAGRAGCGGTESPDAADFGGAEWLASLYWTRVIPDPGVYLCPSSGDSNADGRDLGDEGCCGPGFEAGSDGKLKPDAVSYAAMAATSVAVYESKKLGKEPRDSKIAIRDDMPPNEPMMCDDTEGTINHGRKGNAGMNVLFFDSHVEFWPSDKVDLERGVGQGKLVHLRN